MSTDSASCRVTAQISTVYELANWAPFGAGDVAAGTVDILIEAGEAPDLFSVRLTAPFSRANEVLTLGEVTATEGPNGEGALAGASAELVAVGFAISIRFGSASASPTDVSVILTAEDGL